MSILCVAESLTRLACVINTTFREKIYIRWCCIDRLSWQDFSGGGAPSYSYKVDTPGYGNPASSTFVATVARGLQTLGLTVVTSVTEKSHVRPNDCALLERA